MGLFFWRKKPGDKTKEKNEATTNDHSENQQNSVVKGIIASEEPSVFEFGTTPEGTLSMKGFCLVTKTPGDMVPCAWKVDKAAANQKAKYHIEF